MLKNKKTPMRADGFVMKHVNFMSGRIKLVNVNNQDSQIMLQDIVENDIYYN